MFGFGNKKKKLNKKYEKLIALSYKFSTIDRKKSDEYAYQADQVLQEIAKLEDDNQ